MMSYNNSTLDNQRSEPIEGEFKTGKTVVLTGRFARMSSRTKGHQLTFGLKLFGFICILLGLLFVWSAQKEVWLYGAIALVFCWTGVVFLLPQSGAIASLVYQVSEPERITDSRKTTTRRARKAMAGIVLCVIGIVFGLAGWFADTHPTADYGGHGNRFWATTPTPVPKPPKEPRVKDMGPPVPYGPGATMTPPPPLPVVVLPPVAPPAPRAVTPRAPVRRPPVVTHPIVPKPTTAPKPAPKKDDEYVLPPDLKPPKMDTPKKESHPKYGGDTDLGDSSKVTVHDPVEAGDSGTGD